MPNNSEDATAATLSATLSVSAITGSNLPSKPNNIEPGPPGYLYQYLKLEPGARTVRMLDLHPKSATEHGGRLEGTLRVQELRPGNGTEAYDALSYVWGTIDDPENRPTIRCNGCDIPITWNCHDALSRLSPTDTHRSIWVDSICINQEDKMECSQQVPMMLDIYIKADTVFIWLQNEISTHTGTHAAIQTIHAATLVGRIPAVQDDFGGIHDALTLLLNTPWFYRGWTFQELLLGTNPTFLTKDDVLPWHNVTHLALSHASSIPTRPSLARFLSLTTLWATIHTRRRRRLVMMQTSTYIMVFVLILCGANYFCQKSRFASPHDAPISIWTMLRDSILLAPLVPSIWKKREAPPWLISGFLRMMYPIGDWMILIITMGFPSGVGLGPGLRFPFAWPGSCPRLWMRGLLLLWIVHSLGQKYFVRQARALRDAAYLVTAVPRIAYEHYEWVDLPGLLHLCRGNRQLECAGVMEALRTRRVYKPEDKAYAMFGILKTLGVHARAPDYSIPCQTIYTDLFRDLNSWRPTMLALLVHAGRNSTKVHHMPSWVPDWRTDYNSAWLPEDVLRRCTAKSVYTGVRACGMPFSSINGKTLTVLGRQLDTVTSCIQLPHTALEHPDPAALDAISQWLVKVRGMADYQPEKASDARILADLYHTTQTKASETSSFPRRGNLQSLYNTFIARRGRQSDIESQDELTQFESEADTQDIQVELQRLICGKRLLFVTKNGRYGSGSLKIQEGDAVHLISGVPTPLCLRIEPDSGQYEISGPVIMNHDSSDDIWQGGLRRIDLV